MVMQGVGIIESSTSLDHFVRNSATYPKSIIVTQLDRNIDFQAKEMLARIKTAR